LAAGTVVFTELSEFVVVTGVWLKVLVVVAVNDEFDVVVWLVTKFVVAPDVEDWFGVTV
jgi:hypothetical protein